MNEVHAAQTVLRRAVQHALENGAKRVLGLHLVLGETSTHAEETIRSQWESISKGTAAEGAALHFRRVRAEVQCMACFTRYHPEAGRLVCPNCGSVGARILAGEEFFVEAVDSL